MVDRRGPRVPVTLTPDELRELEAIAAEEGLPLAAVARRGVVREIRKRRDERPPTRD